MQLRGVFLLVASATTGLSTGAHERKNHINALHCPNALVEHLNRFRRLSQRRASGPLQID